jgi:hypothetical protein
MSDALHNTTKSAAYLQKQITEAHLSITNLEHEKAENKLKNSLIFSKLEEALSISTEPIRKFFSAAGLNADACLRRSGSAILAKVGRFFRKGLPRGQPKRRYDRPRYNDIKRL